MEYINARIRRIATKVPWIRGAIVLMVFFVILSLLGEIEPGIVTGTATVVLALLTYISVTQSRDVVTEMQKDREKTGVLTLIAHEIDLSLTNLQEERREFQKVTDPEDHVSYPSLIGSWMGSSQPVIDEIAEKYEEFREDYESYLDLLNRYNREYSELLEATSSYFKSDFPARLEDTMQTIEEVVQQSEREYDGAEDFLRSYDTVPYLNRWLLRGIGKEPTSPWDELTGIINEDELLKLRDHDDLSDRFDQLERLCYDAMELNEKIHSGLENAREGWMDEYGIFETEVNKEKIEMPEDLRFADMFKNR